MSRPTIHDVARRAGVSKSLVSLVIQDAPGVSDARREAVHEVIEELGYRPNTMARSLVQQRSHIVGAMLSNLQNPFFADVVAGIEAQVLESGYRALFNSGTRVPEREAIALETLLELRADGLILAGTLLDMKIINKAGKVVPMVMITRATRSRIVDSVTGDDRAGARIAVDHLVSLGHKRIAHIDGGTGAGAKRRRRGFEAAMTMHGLEPMVVAGTYTEEGGSQGVRELLETDRHPTAIFASNDLAALGSLQALSDAGHSVPDDVSLIGYDNAWLAGLQHISLTTIDQPRHELGTTAVELLIERIEEGRTHARHIVLSPSLVTRSTTGPPARGI
ncbi:MAG: LacI family transcriptional regulator [Actinomycetia bacterium]|nr:LacI family transcriptional regulator [Actinomycetes bacterium]